MIEKVITLDEIPPLEFFGAEHRHMKKLAGAFPGSRLIPRGHEIHIKGSYHEILRINALVRALIAHYHTHGEITEDSIAMYLDKGDHTPATSQPAGLVVRTIGGQKITPRTKNQSLFIDALARNDLIFVTGPSGTGKTFLAVASAVRALRRKEVQRIVISRPAVEAGESLGFLPGDLKEKIGPYLGPVYGALHEMLSPERVQFLQENGVIEVLPLAYMRGRTLSQSFVLLDEAQNATWIQLKMFLTRLGPGSKMVVTGDTSQIDLPSEKQSGLVGTMSLLGKLQGIGCIALGEEDVLRHDMVRTIVSAYDKAEKKSR